MMVLYLGRGWHPFASDGKAETQEDGRWTHRGICMVSRARHRQDHEEEAGYFIPVELQLTVAILRRKIFLFTCTGQHQ